MLKLAVPDMVSPSYFPAEAAIELGFFKRAGLEVSLELIFPVDKAYHALREGAIDIVAGSAHSALAAFPRFDGVKLLCAQSQGMYWFLVMRSEFGAKRGELSVVKGKKIGAAPWVEMGLRRMLIEGGIDLQRDGVSIVPVPAQPGEKVNFGLNAAKALEQRLIDGFWANGMAAELAVRNGVGTLIADARRGDGPSSTFGFTFASIATRSSMIKDTPEQAEAIVRAIVQTQKALTKDVSMARTVGDALFPKNEASLISELVRRDLPYYSAKIDQRAITRMSEFAKSLGLIETGLKYQDVVATVVADLWTS
jgi:ABC-type nitrate/sulfonate/bicarbonate transport system substrate-binding protein